MTAELHSRGAVIRRWRGFGPFKCDKLNEARGAVAAARALGGRRVDAARLISVRRNYRDDYSRRAQPGESVWPQEAPVAIVSRCPTISR
ncbi:hypothetical protein EVAR_4820_1 [Eumeta japonica]|uniref:Uncharacterized protein n=1 Tax=Eumeta variegata TaxID=151549 RepID=A0A4C1T2F6_EUMVA|nr:hypothetical protein EVAR_4820_1 [Eumeta japonica]